MLNNSSIFKKYLICFVLCGFLPIILCSYIMFSLYEKNTLKNTMTDIDYLFNYLSGSIENVSGDMRYISSYINEKSRNNGLMDNLILKRGGTDHLEERQKIITDMIDEVISMNSYVKGVMFVGKDNEMYGTSRISGIFNQNYKPKYNNEIQDYLSGEHTDDFIPTHTSPYYNDETEVVTLVSRFTYTPAADVQPEIMGIMFVDVYIESIGIFFNNLNRDIMSIVYLADLDGNCIYSLNNAWNGRKIYEFQTHKNEGYSQMGGKDFYFKTSPIPGSSWSLVAGIDREYLLSKIKIIKYWTFCIVGIGIFICFALAYMGSKTFAKPIKTILNCMHEAESGNLDVRVNMQKDNEIGQLADGLDAMLGQMQEYIQKEYILRIKQREAELTALKMQIHPHFLYNTLEVIRIEAMKNNDDTAAGMIQLLADQFRYITDNNADEVKIQDELEIIKKYFELVKIRYEGKIKSEINVTNEAQSISIPKLSLQTITENAVIHGLKARGGKIKINGYIENNICSLEIIDNGKGMSRERLDEINSALMHNCKISKQSANSGIGLENVNERLHARYGSKCKMIIESLENIGTSVKIIIEL